MVGLVIAYAVVAVFNGLFGYFAYRSSKNPSPSDTPENQKYHIKVMKEISISFFLIASGGFLAIATILTIPDIGTLISLGLLIVFITAGGIKLSTSMKKLVR